MSRSTRGPFQCLKLMSAFAAAALSLTSACAPKQRFDSHGLRSIELRLRDDLVAEVWGGAMERIDVPGHVVMDGKEHAIRLESAGATSIRSSKKSWDIKLEDGAGWQWNGQGASAKEARLSSMSIDPSMLRSLLAFEVFHAAGSMSSSAEPVFVHLNDRKLGLYILIEKVDEDYFKNRGLELARSFTSQGDATFGPETTSHIEDFYSTKPKPANLEKILALARTLLIADDVQFEAEVFRHLDRAATISYLAASRILNHWDGFNKNLQLIQTKESPLLRPIPWDLDQTWRADLISTLEPWHGNLLFMRIAALPSVRAEWMAKVTALLANEAAPSALQVRIHTWKAKLQDAYAVDPILGLSGKSLDGEADKLMSQISDWTAKIR